MSNATKACAASLYARMLAQDVFANNLANINTIGFKRDKIAFRSALKQAEGRADAAGSAALPALTTKPDFSQGELEATGNKLDLALHGEGFFVLEGPGAQVFYTRDGSFTLDENGLLRNRLGFRVALEEGDVEIPQPAEIGINSRGQVFADGRQVGTLRIVKFPDWGSLERAGSNMFRAGVTPEPAETTKVVQGYLEHSNVVAVEEMVDMLASFRLFEASQKALQARGESLAKLLADKTRIR